MNEKMTLIDKVQYISYALHDIADKMIQYGIHLEEEDEHRKQIHEWAEEINKMSLTAEKIILKGDYNTKFKIALDQAAIVIPVSSAQYKALYDNNQLDKDIYYLVTDDEDIPEEVDDTHYLDNESNFENSDETDTEIKAEKFDFTNPENNKK